MGWLQDAGKKVGSIGKDKDGKRTFKETAKDHALIAAQPVLAGVAQHKTGEADAGLITESDDKRAQEFSNKVKSTNPMHAILGKPPETQQYQGGMTNEQMMQTGRSQELSNSFNQALAARNAQGAPTMQATQLGAASQAGFSDARGRQNSLADMLAAQARGEGTSAAQAQLQQGTDQNIANAMALATTQRGSTAGQRARQIADQSTAAQQQAAQQAAILRAQETQAAQQALGGVLQGMRGQDQNIELANQAANNQFALQQGQMDQAAAQANLNAQLTSQGQKDAMAQFYGGQQTGLLASDRNAAMGVEQMNRDQHNKFYDQLVQKYGIEAGQRAALMGAVGNIGASIIPGLK